MMAIDIIFKIAGIGLLTAIVNIILKKSDKDEIATYVTIAGLILVLILVLDMLGGLFDTLKSILNLY
ncbi:MAG: stage III sporulation protein AC [Clostridia bacterium]|nr:stage III sporulation protein AC [Clostridia bacterium]MCI8944152.1 stage III sporulation protein AC [Clostridia bacterium]MCI9290192.1 stage III sporulation protein AC [Clostridia bacterium]